MTQLGSDDYSLDASLAGVARLISLMIDGGLSGPSTKRRVFGSSASRDPPRTTAVLTRP